MVLFPFSLFAAETVIKNSAPFSFPLTVGVKWKQSPQGKEASFVSRSHCMGRKVVEFSWSLPGKTEKGTISIFTIAGSRIKTFSVNAPEGSIRWEISTDKKVAKGIYFARLTYGKNTKNLKFFVY
jgi:hypothetical protein